MKIEKLTEDHYPEVAGIYLEGIATGHATFQTEAPSWTDWDKSHLEHCRFVAIKNDKVIGWKSGSRLVGTREKIGKMKDVWRETVILERRSKVEGIN